LALIGAAIALPLPPTLLAHAEPRRRDGHPMTPPFPRLERLGCNCTGCRLLRAGVCIRCAAAIDTHIDKQDQSEQIKVTVCSGACREAVECNVASPPGRFDAPRHKGANIQTYAARLRRAAVPKFFGRRCPNDEAG
jgi:hypothetical protein